MSVQAISAVPLNADSKINPKSDAQAEAQAFVSLNNSQLKTLAQMKSYNKKEREQQRKTLAGLFLAIPVVDIARRGIMQKVSIVIDKKGVIQGLVKSPLSAKVASSARSALFWGGSLAVVGALNALKNKAESKSPALKDFDRNNPVLSLLGDMMICFATLLLGYKGIGKILEKSPKTVNKIVEKIINVSAKIDKTKLNTEVLPKLSKKFESFEEKFPSISSALNFTLDNALFFMLGGIVTTGFVQSVKNHDKVEKNYQELKDLQLAMAKSLVEK